MQLTQKKSHGAFLVSLIDRLQKLSKETTQYVLLKLKLIHKASTKLIYVNLYDCICKQAEIAKKNH